ncbi:MAG: hypothetical protein IPJ18_06370 [Betaproteobacteria bacterium]|nr:hypothetical protein [Betaproteobacteria bacterium]
MQCGLTDLWLIDATYEPAAQANQAAGNSDIRAPFNGKLIRIAVADGQTVHQGRNPGGAGIDEAGTPDRRAACRQSQRQSRSA